MVILDCGVPNCTCQTSDSTDAIFIALPNNHNLAHRVVRTNNVNVAPCPRGSKLWTTTHWHGSRHRNIERVRTIRWDNFRRGCSIEKASASLQLFQCATDDLGDGSSERRPNDHVAPHRSGDRSHETSGDNPGIPWCQTRWACVHTAEPRWGIPSLCCQSPGESRDVRLQH